MKSSLSFLKTTILGSGPLFIPHTPVRGRRLEKMRLYPPRKMMTGEKNLLQYVPSAIQGGMEFVFPAREVTVIGPVDLEGI